jgi:hypothetical protein
MNLRVATISDINTLTKISIESFDPYNFVMGQLGEDYVREVFFPALLRDSNSYVVISESDGQVQAYAAGSLSYKNFSRTLRHGNLPRTAWYLLAGFLMRRVTFGDIYDVLRFDSNVVKTFSHLPSFGPYAVSPTIKGTPLAGIIARKTCIHVLDWMAAKGAVKCWATVDSRNTASQGLVELLGFKKSQELVLSRRVEYLYWNEF